MNKFWVMNSILFCVPRGCVFWGCIGNVCWMRIEKLVSICFKNMCLEVCVLGFRLEICFGFCLGNCCSVLMAIWRSRSVCFFFPLCIFSLFGVEPDQHVKSFPTHEWCEYKEANRDTSYNETANTYLITKGGERDRCIRIRNVYICTPKNDYNTIENKQKRSKPKRTEQLRILSQSNCSALAFFCSLSKKKQERNSYTTDEKEDTLGSEFVWK